MNLNAAQVEELNERLRKEDLGFPDFRKNVTSGGGNYSWIKKALEKTGKGSEELRNLVGLTSQ